jgi:hypothetical protein
MENRRRDVEVIPLGSETFLVLACDSCGAVGSKELDMVHAPPYVAGRYTARVALFEVMAVGAEPKAVSVTISNEPSPTGEEILQGVKDELSGLNAGNIPVAASTEKNFFTRQTALGVTVVGVCNSGKLRLTSSRLGDDIFCLGIPRMGNEVGGHDDAGTVQLSHLQTLLKCNGIHDIIPVGSKGIQWEAETLADTAKMKLILEADTKLDLVKSGGPSSCVVFSCVPKTNLPEFNAISLAKIGKLE